MDYSNGEEAMKVLNLEGGGLGLLLEHGDIKKYDVIIKNILSIPNLEEIHFKNLSGREAMYVRNNLNRFIEVSGFYDIDLKIKRKDLTKEEK